MLVEGATGAKALAAGIELGGAEVFSSQQGGWNEINDALGGDVGVGEAHTPAPEVPQPAIELGMNQALVNNPDHLTAPGGRIPMPEEAKPPAAAEPQAPLFGLAKDFTPPAPLESGTAEVAGVTADQAIPKIEADLKANFEQSAAADAVSRAAAEDGGRRTPEEIQADIARYDKAQERAAQGRVEAVQTQQEQAAPPREFQYMERVNIPRSDGSVSTGIVLESHVGDTDGKLYYRVAFGDGYKDLTAEQLNEMNPAQAEAQDVVSEAPEPAAEARESTNKVEASREQEVATVTIQLSGGRTATVDTRNENWQQIAESLMRMDRAANSEQYLPSQAATGRVEQRRVLAPAEQIVATRQAAPEFNFATPESTAEADEPKESYLKDLLKKGGSLISGILGKLTGFLGRRPTESAAFEQKYSKPMKEMNAQFEKARKEMVKAAEKKMKVLKRAAQDLLKQMPQVSEALNSATENADKLETALDSLKGLSGEWKEYGNTIKGIRAGLRKTEADRAKYQAESAAFQQKIEGILNEMMVVAAAAPEVNTPEVQGLIGGLQGLLEGKPATAASASEVQTEAPAEAVEQPAEAPVTQAEAVAPAATQTPEAGSLAAVNG